MIVHTVMIKLKNPAQDAQTLREKLEALPTKIEQVRYYEVGLNALASPRNYDLAIYSHFDSFDDLAIYAEHPDHLPIIEYVKTIAENVIAVDYERD